MSDPTFQLYAIDDPPPVEVSFVLEIRRDDGAVIATRRVDTRWSDAAIESFVISAASSHGIADEHRDELVWLALELRNARKPDLAAIDRAMRDDRRRSRTR